MAITPGLIETLKDRYSQIQTLDPSGPGYKRLCAILDHADDDTLKFLHNENIKFVSPLAFNRMIRRGLVEPG